MCECIKHDWPARRYDEPADEHAIEDHAEEEFEIVEPDTVAYPGAVVVHFENAFVALRAVVASIGFCFETPAAHSNTTFLFGFVF